MFKNCARAENEICLCQFGLYTGKSHILRTPGYQQQVHPARGRATGEQHCRGWCSGNETAESLGWTQKIHAWGGLQNEIQSTRIFVKSRKLSFPQKLPLETTFHPWNSAAYTCFFFWLAQCWWLRSHRELTHSQAQKTQRKQRSCPSPGDKTVIPSLPPQALAHCSSWAHAWKCLQNKSQNTYNQNSFPGTLGTERF